MTPLNVIHRFVSHACALSVASLLLAASASLAQAQTAPALPSAGAHLSGGIGEEERLQMRDARDRYNLRLVFAQARSGAYLAGVDVAIDRPGAQVALGPYDAVGPWFFVRLDPGTYRIRATYDGVTQTRTVRVGRAASERVFYWPAR